MTSLITYAIIPPLYKSFSTYKVNNFRKNANSPKNCKYKTCTSCTYDWKIHTKN